MRLRSDAIVSCDSGTISTWFARHIPVKRGQMIARIDPQIPPLAGLPDEQARLPRMTRMRQLPVDGIHQHRPA